MFVKLQLLRPIQPEMILHSVGDQVDARIGEHLQAVEVERFQVLPQGVVVQELRLQLLGQGQILSGHVVHVRGVICKIWRGRNGFKRELVRLIKTIKLVDTPSRYI